MKSFFTFAHTCRHLSRVLLVITSLVGGGNFAWGQKTLPYSYGFEGNDLAGEGWTAQGLYSLSGIKQTGSWGIVVHEGSYSFRFYNNSGYASQYLISPELSNTETGVDVSFYYTTNIANYNEQFKIGYSTTTSDVSTAFTWYDETPTSDTSWHKYERSFPAGTKYIALLYTYVNDNSRLKLFIDDISLETSETYKRPKDLVVDTYTSSSVTLSWTAGGSYDGETWQIAYSTKENFDPDTEGIKINVTEKPYLLSGLQDGYTYYAYVRSNYSPNYSGWSNMVQFTPFATSLINDGETTSSIIPIYGNSVANVVNSQFIIPASDLTSILNREIRKLTFYTKGSSYETVSWGNATFEVYLNMVSTEKYNSTTKEYEDWGTKVFNEAKLSVTNYMMEVVFDTPFKYTGNNLMIGFKQIATGTNSKVDWYAISKTYGNNYGIYTYGSSTSTSYVVPKVTITTTASTASATIGLNGYTTFASPRALDLSSLPDGLKAYKARVVNDRVKFTEIDQAVPANTGILLEGTEETTYFIPVAASGTAPEGNEFLVNSTGGTFTADANSTYYGLVKATTAEEKPVFGTFDPASVAIPSNKAYLKVAGSGARLTCWFDNETTGIGEAQRTISDSGATTVFDLQGRRVAVGDGSAERTQLPKGVYIVNGRKVVVK